MCSICFANSVAASLLILVRSRGGKRIERRPRNKNLTLPTVLDQAYLNLRRVFGRVPIIKSKLFEFVRRCQSLAEFWSFI